MKKMETTNDTYADTLTTKKMETTNDTYADTLNYEENGNN